MPKENKRRKSVLRVPEQIKWLPHLVLAFYVHTRKILYPSLLPSMFIRVNLNHLGDRSVWPCFCF